MQRTACSRCDEPVLPAEHLRDLRVLRAEHNMTDQLVFRWLIVAAVGDVDTASNGLEALTSIERQSYDVVLMDAAIPEMVGLETTWRIRQTSAFARTVMALMLLLQAKASPARAG